MNITKTEVEERSRDLKCPTIDLSSVIDSMLKIARETEEKRKYIEHLR